MGLSQKDKDKQAESVCPYCGSEECIEDQARGEQTCTSCGSVKTQNIADYGPEWRAFTAEEVNRRARAGAPMSFSRADKGLSTIIGYGSRDAKGGLITGRRRADIFRMRRWQFRSLSHSTMMRNFSIAMQELDRLCSQLQIPRDIKETSAYIYRKAFENRSLRGRKIDALVAASLYIACRMHHIPRQLDEVAAEAKVNKKELGAAVRRILTHTRIKIPLPSSTELIPKISSVLGIEGRTIARAISIIDDAREKGLTIGKAPGGIAGAAIYIASIIEQDQRTQRQIAEAASVTEVTIRNRYKQLVTSLNITLI